MCVVPKLIRRGPYLLNVLVDQIEVKVLKSGVSAAHGHCMHKDRHCVRKQAPHYC